MAMTPPLKRPNAKSLLCSSVAWHGSTLGMTMWRTFVQQPDWHGLAALVAVRHWQWTDSKTVF